MLILTLPLVDEATTSAFPFPPDMAAPRKFMTEHEPETVEPLHER